MSQKAEAKPKPDRKLLCGCEWKDGTYVPCEEHRLRHQAEQLTTQILETPQCPDCKMDARRPKCFFEQGSDCPRHPVLDAWNKARAAIQGYLQLQEALGD